MMKKETISQALMNKNQPKFFISVSKQSLLTQSEFLVGSLIIL
jgi:hypothetical protein